LRLSVVIPVYNEQDTIEEVLRRVRAAAEPGRPIEIIVVDDASTDDTPAGLERSAAPDMVVMRHASNRGKGAAVRTALGAVTGDVVIVQDADLEYDPQDFRALVQPIERGEAEVVYGSRIMGRNPHSYLRYYYGGRLLTLIFNLLYGVRLTDLTTCYKAFARETLLALPLTCERFEFCPEVTARLVRRGIRIPEVPIRYAPRSMTQGKKIRWTDGFEAIRVMLALRWAPLWPRKGR